MTRLPAQPTLSHGDATLNFDRLQGILGLTGAKGQYLKLAVVGIHKVAFGTGLFKWSAKGFESAATSVVTGLTKITAMSAICFGSAQVVAGVSSITGGTIAFIGRDVVGEIAEGVEVAFYWIAVE